MMSEEMKEYIECFSCKAKSLNIEGDTHEYMLAAPGCWAMFCEILEKEYTDFRYAKAHHYTIDAYACQHPGKKEITQAIKSVGIHLSSLYMIIERGMDLSEGGNFKNKFAQFNKQHDFIHWLHPPSNLESITVYDVWDLKDRMQHYKKCRAWAESTWNAWEEHHEIIKEWVKYFLKQESYDFKLNKKIDYGAQSKKT